MIFLTGATGLIGSQIARKLLEQNYAIRALKRKTSDLSLVKDIAHRIEWVEGDILDVLFLNECLKGVDSVIHAAAIVSFAKRSQDQMMKVNVQGTANMVNAALKNNIQQFCHISSVSALGRGKSQIIDETSKWEDSNENTNYGKSKYMAELEVWRAMEEGLNAVIINPSVALGPGLLNSGSTRIFKYILNQSPFYTPGEMNYIDVRDVAEIVIQLLEKKIHSGRFILNAGKISYKDLFGKIAEGFNKRKPFFEAGYLLSQIAWRVEAAKALITGKEPVITKETARIAHLKYFYNSSKINSTLNFQFRDINDTIAWTCSVLVNRGM